jgi:uncharacterized protein YndB with AHSA1/START domain
MPAISEIIINKPASHVWSAIADATTHPHWLGQDAITKYEGDAELAEGLKFTRVEKATGITTEGEVVALRPPQFLKVRVDAPEMFVVTEYHLLAVREGCALRVTCEVYDTGEKRHGYFPEEIEQRWHTYLQRLKNYCEAR